MGGQEGRQEGVKVGREQGRKTKQRVGRGMNKVRC